MKKLLTILSAVVVAMAMLIYSVTARASSNDPASFSNDRADYTLELIDVDGDSGAKMCFGGSCQSLDANPTIEFMVFANTTTESVRGTRLKYSLPPAANGQLTWRDINPDEWLCDSMDFVVKCSFTLMESYMDGYKLEDIVLQLSSGTSSSSSPAIPLTSCVTEPSVHGEFDHAKMCSIIVEEEEESVDDDGLEEGSIPNTDNNPNGGGNNSSGLSNLPGMSNNSSGCSLNPAAGSNSGGLLLILTTLAYIVMRRKK